MSGFFALRWRATMPDHTALTRIQIGPRVLDVDNRLIHAGPQRAGGVFERLDLIVSWPDLAP
ncbi:MAG: hypothetical protein ABWZ80_01685, partial [Beijerinckiaceae bacterium]